MSGKTINTLHRSKTGKVSDKWASYLPHYDVLFGPLRGHPVCVLEIGVQNGGSLETWAAFFQAGDVFVGCDIDPKSGCLQNDDPRINIVVGDVNTAPAFEKITSIKTGSTSSSTTAHTSRWTSCAAL